MLNKIAASTHELPVSPSRRNFLKTSAAASGALVLSAYVPLGNKAYALTANDPPQPNVFIHITPDNTVTVIIKHLDKGQGIATGLSTIVADELDADWAQVKSEFAPANVALYNNLAFGVQGTGGSSGVANSWKQLRDAGAAARAMLIQAAAETWKVPAASVHIEKGVLISGSHKRHSARWRQRPRLCRVPAKVTPKDPKDWIYIGKVIPRLELGHQDHGAADLRARSSAAGHVDRRHPAFTALRWHRRRASMRQRPRPSRASSMSFRSRKA